MCSIYQYWKNTTLFYNDINKCSSIDCKFSFSSTQGNIILVVFFSAEFSSFKVAKVKFYGFVVDPLVERMLIIKPC